MVGRQVAGEYILVPLVGRGADLDSIYNLNRVGAFIWEQLDGQATGAAIIDALVGHFDVEAATARRDYARFVEELSSIGAITKVSGP